MSRGEPKTRHYLSVYMAPPDETALACTRHDHCAALWRETGNLVEIVRYWEFERVTGMKHHRVPLREPAQARRFLNSLLAEEGLDLDRLDAVWGTPWLETDRAYTSCADGTDLPLHSLSHLFAALLVDWQVFRDETIVAMAMDLAPDWTLDRARVGLAYAGCVSVRGSISFFPIESPAPLWHVVRERFGLEEGTLMALASATGCSVPFEDQIIQNLHDIEHWNPAVSIPQADHAIDEIIAFAERALRAADAAARCFYDDRFDFVDNLRSAVMKVVDAASTNVVERNLARIQRAHQVDFAECYLAMGGGYALNCPGNTRVLDRHRFRGLLAPPCVNDGGQALGIGLMALHGRGLAPSASFRLPHAFLGREQLNLDRALETFAPFVKSVQSRDLDQVIDDIAASPVAWVDGPAEAGPRALGHRSILGDPVNPATKVVLNTVKGRQWWRPVAPMVLAEEVATWFETDRLSPFMLEAVACRPDRAHRVPAALHLDGTARLQTVAACDDPVLHELLERQHRRNGVPMLCNTSLNDRGEPIVDDAEQALNFCIRKGLPVAYVGTKRIELADPTCSAPDERAERRNGMFLAVAAGWHEEWLAVTGQGIPAEAIFLSGWSPELRDRLLNAIGDDTLVRRFARFVANVVDRMLPDDKAMLDAWLGAFGPTGHPVRQGQAELDVII